MTPAEARAHTRLNPPLHFGNPEQIEAADFLAAMQECKEFLDKAEKAGYELIETCPCCKGRGFTRCPECDSEHDCHTCNGACNVSIDCDDCTTSAQVKNLLAELRRKFPEV